MHNRAQLPEEDNQIGGKGVSDTPSKAMLARYEPRKLAAEILRCLTTGTGMQKEAQPREGAPASPRRRPELLHNTPAILPYFGHSLHVLDGRSFTEDFTTRCP